MQSWDLASGKSGIKRLFPFGLSIAALVTVLALSSVYVVRSQACAVTVSAWDRQVNLFVAPETTVREVLERANVVLEPGDFCVPGPEEMVEDGSKVTISRGCPRFVACDGKISVIVTCCEQVSGVLDLAQVVLGPEDIVTPGLEDVMADCSTIKVVRVTYGEEVQEISTDFDTETRKDDSLEVGLTRVYKNGSRGLARVTYAVRYEDRKAVRRDEVKRETIKEPSNKVVLVGTLRQVARGGESLRFTKAVEVSSTAYCPCAKCCGKYANGYTHTGLPAKKGVIAVDPSVIPLGTRVYVDGYGYAVAADTGSAIKGTRIDVCFDTHEEALKWGMKKVKVFLLE